LNSLTVVFLTLVFGTFAARATTTKVELILSAETARPGDTVMAGIRLTMQPGWHTYWKNPGGPGIPIEIQRWTLPPGITAGEIQWPVPESQTDDPFVNYVYTDEAILLVPLKIDSTTAAGSFMIQTHISWQECNIGLCLTDQVDLSAPLTIGTESQPSFDAEAIEKAKNKLPKSGANLSVAAHWEGDDEKRPMILEWQTTNKPAEVDFFPYAHTNYEVQGQVERLPDAAGKIRIQKLVTKSGTEWPTKIDGLWVVREKPDSPPEGYEVTLTLPTLVETPAFADATANLSLFGAFGLAFLGGLLLNIMPCVLPVIALKILGFVSQARESPGRVRTLGLVYGVGVLVSFLVLAGVAIGIQKAGGLASWSTAFQNPQFRVIITTLITLVALNLFGVFEITLGGNAMSAAGELTAKKGAPGAFFNGVLATLLATPCTAPFLAGALGFAFTQPPVVIVLIFLTIGVGLAAPYVLLCWHPAWLKFLPKPGLWMQRFKVAMGFPMLATAMWLFWLTATRMGKSGVLWLGLFLVVLATAAWVWGEFTQRGRRHPGLAMLISLLLVAGAYGFVLEHKLHWRSPAGTVTEKDPIDWQPWSKAAVEKARTAGHPVLVDFTADSCVNCQVNLALSIDVRATREKLKQINAVTLVADYTDSDATIAAELKRFGQAGVPLVLVYSADKSRPPIVMPPRFSESEMLAALNKAATNAIILNSVHR
jgi:thiol:disulfide interchange protein DsbD